MYEDRWSLSSDTEDEQYCPIKQGKHRIPTALKPLEPVYLQPIQQYLNQWKDNPDFYHDFVYSCPFNQEITKHMINKTETLSTHKSWEHLVEYFSTIYTAHELADLIYEALSNLNEGQLYLSFLINHQYSYMWPKGDNFCDPSLPIPYDLTH